MNILRCTVAAMLYIAASACTHDSKTVVTTETQQPTTAAVATPTNAEANEPAVESMQPAKQSGKLSAPVDVLYRFSDEVATDRPVRVDFVVTPQVPGDNLRFELAATDSAVVETADAKLSVQKAEANGVYRKSVTLTPRAGLDRLQVIVYMNVGADTYSGVYSVPVGAASDAAAESGKKGIKDVQR